MIGGYAAVVSGDYSLAAWLAVAMTWSTCCWCSGCCPSAGGGLQ